MFRISIYKHKTITYTIKEIKKNQNMDREYNFLQLTYYVTIIIWIFDLFYYNTILLIILKL